MELGEVLTPPLDIDTELELELGLELVDPYGVGLIGPMGEPEEAKLMTELELELEDGLGDGVGEGVGEP